MQIFLHFFAKKVNFSCIYQNLFVNLYAFLLRIALNCLKIVRQSGVIALLVTRALCALQALGKTRETKKQTK